MPVILGLFAIFVFFFILYMVVKSAVNNSELLKEIKVMLMKAQNEDNNRR